MKNNIYVVCINFNSFECTDERIIGYFDSASKANEIASEYYSIYKELSLEAKPYPEDNDEDWDKLVNEFYTQPEKYRDALKLESIEVKEIKLNEILYWYRV